MIKTMLAVLSGYGSDRTVLESAIALARTHDAHIHCLHSRIDAVDAATAMWLPETGDLREAVKAITAEEQKRSRHASEAFAEAQARHGLILGDKGPEGGGASLFWQETKGFSFDALHQARYHDLVVAGRDAELSLEPIHTLLMQAGRPVLLAPPKAPEQMGRKVAIAWKETPEAARAVAAALPILARAEKLFVLTASEGKDDPEGAARLAAYLAWHGLHAEIRRGDGGVAAGKALQEMAYAADADLLVMGAYGHSRIREWAFGGVTREMLRACALPVLMCS